MTGAFNRAVTGARQKATDLVNRVVAFLRTLPGKAASAVAALWSRMISAFTRAVTGARQKAVDLVNRFVAFLRTLPGKAASAVRGVRSAILGVFAGAGSWLLGAGRQIVAGLAAGIRGGVSSVISAAVSVARSAISAAKSALGISSPSKVFAEQVGKPIAQGIGLGMRRNIKDEFKELPGMLPQLGGNRGTSSSARSYSSTFNPTINVHVAAGLDPVDGAARRALVKGLYLETEKFRKDYVK
jgi:phage-related protein